MNQKKNLKRSRRLREKWKKKKSKNQYQRNLNIQKIKRKIYQKKYINTQTVSVRVEEKYPKINKKTGCERREEREGDRG
jgi:hypothetical protein